MYTICLVEDEKDLSNLIKTYLENNAQYQKYIAILNSLNGVLEELVKIKRDDE